MNGCESITVSVVLSAKSPSGEPPSSASITTSSRFPEQSKSKA